MPSWLVTLCWIGVALGFACALLAVVGSLLCSCSAPLGAEAEREVPAGVDRVGGVDDNLAVERRARDRQAA